MNNPISKFQVNSILTHIIINNQCPPEILTEILKRNVDDWVSRDAIRHPNCPSEILAKIVSELLADPSYIDNKILRGALSNPNCPPESLVKLLKKGKDNYASFIAHNNPNCPPEVKKEWKEKVELLINCNYSFYIDNDFEKSLLKYKDFMQKFITTIKALKTANRYDLIKEIQKNKSLYPLNSNLFISMINPEKK